MSLTMFWPGLLKRSVKKVNTKRINASAKVEKLNQIYHLITPPVIVKHDSGDRIIPKIARKRKKVAA